MLDHFAYIWLVHRPKESMFKKVGLIITSAGGSGVKDTVRLIKSNMFYWGVPTIYNYGVTTMKMGGNYEDYKNKDKIKKQVKVKAGKIKRSLKNKKIGLKSKLQKNDDVNRQLTLYPSNVAFGMVDFHLLLCYIQIVE